MTRYIDADWIYQMVENRYRVSSGIEHRCERDLLDLICEAPTANVVPKSEVEELIRENESLAKTVNEASGLIRKLRSKVNKSKNEVAREIFEEIENLYMEEHNGCAVHMSRYEFAELKKKYTED